MAIVIAVLVGVIVLLLIGSFVVGLVFKLLWWAIIGVAIGALARLVLPGKQNISILATAGAGIAAALLGGVVAQVFGFGGILQFLLAILAAVVIVGVMAASGASKSST